MPKKKKTRVKAIDLDAILERESAEEAHDVRKATVTTILEGVRKDRDKR